MLPKNFNEGGVSNELGNKKRETFPAKIFGQKKKFYKVNDDLQNYKGFSSFNDS